MADFKTHITTSSAIGVVYGLAGHLHWGLPPSTCIVSAGLCGLAGMLPDMDSDTGHAQREIMTYAATATPLLMISRFDTLGLDHEEIVLAAASIYVLIRFGLGELLRRYVRHRGMFHSIPAAIIAGLVASMVCSCDVLSFRAFIVGAVVLGFMVHLVLDELWAIEWYRGGLRFKNSFGTALKIFSPRWFPNLVTYALLLLSGVAAYNDPLIMEYLGAPPQQEHFAHDHQDHENELLR